MICVPVTSQSLSSVSLPLATAGTGIWGLGYTVGRASWKDLAYLGACSRVAGFSRCGICMVVPGQSQTKPTLAVCQLGGRQDHINTRILHIGTDARST